MSLFQCIIFARTYSSNCVILLPAQKNITLKDLKHTISFHSHSLSVSLRLSAVKTTFVFAVLTSPAAPSQSHLVNIKHARIRDPISGDGGAVTEAETQRRISKNRLTGERWGWGGRWKMEEFFFSAPPLPVCATSAEPHEHL